MRIDDHIAISATTAVKREPNSQQASIGAKAGKLFARLLKVTAATAVTGAVANFLYELFFRPDLYAAGHPIFRGAFLLVFTSPFILFGLVVLGLPISYLLKRFNFENSASYALAGALSGVLFGVSLSQLHNAEWLVLVALFGVGSALFWWWFRPRS